MEQGKLANLLKETEKGLFRANRQLKAAEKLGLEISSLLKNLELAEETAKQKPELGKELGRQMRQSNIVGQSNELFSLLGTLRQQLELLSEAEARAKSFVEVHRTKRLYSFDSGDNSAKFARQLFELFSAESVQFKPRFIGPIDFNEIAEQLNLKKSPSGLALRPRDIRPFVRAMSQRKFASNISLEAAGLKLVWQDKKNVLAEGPVERLFRLDRLCTALGGKCLER